MIKKIAKYIIVFIILILVFNFLLFISSLFSSELIEENVRESSDKLSEEGNIYQIFKYSSVVNNNYTDALMINEAYSIDNTNPIYSYMAVRKNYSKDLTNNSIKDTTGELISVNSKEYNPVGELEEFLNGNIDTTINYARYWHGYLPVLRTLLIFFNITQIRIILLIIFIILFIWLIKLIKDKIGTSVSIIFGFSLIVEGYFFVSYSLESTPVFLVMIVSSIILLKRIDKIHNLYLYIFIISCITNFVDYLTVPLITLAIPLLLYILYKQKENTQLNCKHYLVLILKSSLVWIVGYGATWLSKWIIYDMICKEGLIQAAMNQVFYRSYGNVRNFEITINERMLTFIVYNFEYATMLFGIRVLFILIAYLRGKIYIELKKLKTYLNENILILIISLMPLAWYMVLQNHTIIHYRWVYRHMLIFLIGILICLKNIFVIKKKEIPIKTL